MIKAQWAKRLWWTLLILIIVKVVLLVLPMFGVGVELPFARYANLLGMVMIFAVLSALIYLSWVQALILALVLPFLHYNLPQHDVVRITETGNRLTTLGSINQYFYASQDLGTVNSTSRDVRFIDAVYPDGSVMVFRNEDTGFWPPYLKFDSSNLQAEASNYKSTAETPKWVSITHYGWRIGFESIFPNAVRITPVDGPDVTIIPWSSILILSLLAAGVFMARRMWLQFWERMVDPAVARAEEAGDKARGWFQRLFGGK
jgi:hypothetical protein